MYTTVFIHKHTDSKRGGCIPLYSYINILIANVVGVYTVFIHKHTDSKRGGCIPLYSYINILIANMVGVYHTVFIHKHTGLKFTIIDIIIF